MRVIGADATRASAVGVLVVGVGRASVDGGSSAKPRVAERSAGLHAVERGRLGLRVDVRAVAVHRAGRAAEAVDVVRTYAASAAPECVGVA